MDRDGEPLMFSMSDYPRGPHYVIRSTRRNVCIIKGDIIFHLIRYLFSIHRLPSEEQSGGGGAFLSLSLSFMLRRVQVVEE